MNLRTRLRRWRIGPDLYDSAILTIAAVDNAETEGRDHAWAFIRKVHAEHPRSARRCSVPNCCGGAA